MAEPRSSVTDAPAAAKVLAVIGAYFLMLGVWRGFEVLELPADTPVASDFPAWLLGYLAALTATMAVAGLLMVCGAIAGMARKRRLVRLLGAPGALLGLCVVAAHGYFVAVYERAFGEGGFVWGVIHLVTLTRLYIPDGATEAGLFGYRIGQIAGFALWTVAVLLALADAVQPSRLALHQPRGEA